MLTADMCLLLCKIWISCMQNYLELQLHFFMKQKDKLKFEKQIVSKETSKADKSFNCWFIGSHNATRGARSQIYDHKSNSDKTSEVDPSQPHWVAMRIVPTTDNRPHHSTPIITKITNCQLTAIQTSAKPLNEHSFCCQWNSIKVSNSAMQPWLKSSPTTTWMLRLSKAKGWNSTSGR